MADEFFTDMWLQADLIVRTLAGQPGGSSFTRTGLINEFAGVETAPVVFWSMVKDGVLVPKKPGRWVRLVQRTNLQQAPKEQEYRIDPAGLARYSAKIAESGPPPSYDAEFRPPEATKSAGNDKPLPPIPAAQPTPTAADQNRAAFGYSSAFAAFVPKSSDSRSSIRSAASLGIPGVGYRQADPRHVQAPTTKPVTAHQHTTSQNRQRGNAR
ncbi:hypothetical protein [Streptomyces sp. NPDC029554]|uniref:hypothetical protein n=1 Tax=Streptomyces sp. NPDC029554 TaxID=3155126 RepID=UPI0033D068B3